MAGQHVLEVTTATFENDVIQKSRTVPVLVHFWAPWCSPCLMLAPILEKVVRELDGKLILAKVNTDSSPELAAQYGVRSIPAVKLFAGGTVAAEFTGALPEPQIREFIQKALPSGADELVARARELQQSGQLKEAEALAQKALQEDPKHEVALEIAATAAMAAGRVDEALDLINRMDSPSKDMQFLSEGAEFWRLCTKMAAEAKSFDVPPEDLDGKITSAASLAAKGELVPALDLLLEVVEADKSFRESLARKAMVSLFVVIGLDNPFVKEYQSRLARLLF